MKLIQDPGDPAARNYPVLSNDAYREGWERIFGRCPSRSPRHPGYQCCLRRGHEHAHTIGGESAWTDAEAAEGDKLRAAVERLMDGG